MAKKKEETESKKGKLQETLDKLNKQYGEGTILTMDSKSHSHHDVISSGSIGVDWIVLGIGGFARGKLYELMGWEGSGKSTICGHAVAECQKKGGKVLYIDGEHAVDKVYFQALGVDTDKMLLAQPSSGEEGFNIAAELISTGEIDLVIIDSDSSLIPKSALDGEIGDSSIGKKARLNGSAYPKLKTLISQNNTCCIVVSQFREKIGVMFGNPETTQGGHALKFYSDCRLEVRKSLLKEGDNVIGNTTKVKALKNKMSAPYKVSHFEVLFGVGIDKIGELIKLATELEIIKKWGQSVTWEDFKYNYEEFITLLASDDEIHSKLKLSVIEAIRNTEFKPEVEEI